MSIPGLRGTGAFTTDFRPTNYRELYTFLEPNGDAPLNALLAMLQSEATDDPKYSNFRDEMPSRVLDISVVGGGGNVEITVTPAADAGWVTTGSILVCSETGEVMRATTNGNTSTGRFDVTRNIGGTSFALTNANNLFVAGHAAEEGSGSPQSVVFESTVDFNYTQIFKRAFQLTGTLSETYLRTGDKEDEYRVKALKLHMQDLERAHFWSRRSETDGPGGQKLRTTGGLIPTLTNVIDFSQAPFSGTVTEDQWDRVLINDIFAYGSKTKVAYVGRRIAGHMQAIGKDRWSPQTISDTYGISFTRYMTPAGTLLVYLHPQFRMLTHMDAAMVIIDTDFIKYRHMQNRDTKLDENIQGNDEDAVKHQYVTECGLELLQNKVHAYVTGWTNLG